MEVKKESEREEETGAETGQKSRVSFAGSWAGDKADDIAWGSSMEQRRYPIVIFNPLSLSQPSANPAGARYHLTFKVVQADAKIVSQIFHAHGFHEVGPNNIDFNLMWKPLRVQGYLRKFLSTVPLLWFMEVIWCSLGVCQISMDRFVC